MSPKDNNKQVSAAVRILQQKRDASARATHLMVKNDPLITYEKAFLNQAAVKKFFIATFLERKIMSTKTSIKRIALVAAAALAIGGFSAVSANAENAQLRFNQGDGAAATPFKTGAGVAGPANSVKVQLIPLAGKDQVLTITGGTFASADTTTVVIATGGATASRAATAAGNALITIPTPTVGTITVSLFNGTNGVFGTTAAETVVITVNATAASGIGSVAKSTVFLAAGETSTAVAADASVTVASTPAPAGDTTTGAATIQVFYKDGLGAALTSESVTATIISGPGTLNSVDSTSAAKPIDTSTSGGTMIANVLNQYSKTVNTGNTGMANFIVWPNGQVGVSTIVVKAGTLELGRKTITFAGTTPATVAATVKKAYVLNSNTVTDTAIAVTVADSAGYAVTGASVTIAPATGSTVGAAGSCAYNSTDKVYYCTVRASTAQAALTTDAEEVYTITAATGVTTTAKVMFVSAAVKTLTIAGPASANPGEKITYTLTAKGANGNPIPDAVYAGNTFTKAPSASASLVSTPFNGVAGTESITVTNGVATATTFAPFGGALEITWTVLGTAGAATGTAGIGTVSIDKALTATDIVSTVDISSDATAALALDAANAATDAANNAYDEAQNATQAASDALAAVTALAKQVKSLIASVKRLTAAVAKLK
jgi:hypothetical protein